MLVRRPFLVVGAVLACGLGARIAQADEVDELVRRVGPPARFQGHRAEFSVEKKAFRFEYLGGARTQEFFIIRDRGRHVGLIPLRGGAITILDSNPRTAPRTWTMPPDRWRIETALGTVLRTDAFIPSKEGAKESTYQFTKGDGTLTLVRRFKGTGRFSKWTFKSKTPVTVDARNTFVLRCDPVLGYVVEGTYESGVKPPPKTFQYFSAFTRGMCSVWATEDDVSRTVITPTHRAGYEGYALNFACIDWCDNDRKKFRCRDGGFAAFLNRKTGWSPATTLVGSEARFVVCNAHADLDFVTDWPADAPVDKDGLSRRVVKTRVLALPPEITNYLWENMSVRFTDRRRTQIRIGVPESFEDQPLPLTTWVRGLYSTGGGPKITEDFAHSGKKSAVLTGRFWPNLPQVPLEGGVRYRLDAWLKVVPWTAEQREAAEAKERKRIEKQRARGKKAEDFKGFGPPEAYITGHLYVSSPHQKKWVVEQRANKARPGGPEWQKLSLEFTAPKWAPFINFVFVATSCTAYLDDFHFRPVGVRPDASGRGARR